MALANRAGAADRRRADHGPRRHRPGADPGAPARSPARDRHGAAADHPRPRRGRRHRRPGGGHAGRADRRDRCRSARCCAGRSTPTPSGCWRPIPGRWRCRRHRGHVRPLRRCSRSVTWPSTTRSRAGCSAAGRARWSGPWTASASSCAGARPWASSASPAPASRRSGALILRLEEPTGGSVLLRRRGPLRA